MLHRLILTLLALSLLNACGFQLRGAGGTNVPDTWKQMYLSSGNPNSELSRELSATFSANDVEWVERDEANYMVKVGPERFSQRNLSINAQARAAEFELTMTTTFSVLDDEGEVVIEENKATVIKQMENDPRNVVGKAEEIRLLKAEMRSELVQQILRRIGYYAASSA